MLAIETQGGETRLSERLTNMSTDGYTIGCLCDDGNGPITDETIAVAYSSLDETLQRAAMIMADHDEAVTEFGAVSPEAKLMRETYAAAMVDAAQHGKIAPPLDPLVSPMFSTSDAELIAY